MGSSGSQEQHREPYFARTSSRTSRKALLVLTLIALVPRLYVALTTTYLYDEQRDWIPLANSISLEPSSWNTPIRGAQHPALPGYGIALGRALLGHNELGTRAVGLILGVATVLLIFLCVRDVGGSAIASWIGALLLAANEYHIHASVLATEKAYYLFFAALAIWFFLRFMREERAKWLYWAAVATGLSFLSKETAALLGAVFIITLVATRFRVWFRRREAYFAALLCFAVISPDIWWNVTNQDPDAAADYSKHLAGVGSLGITYQPLLLYGREAVSWLLGVTGLPFYDNAEEYAAGNFLLSLIIAGGVLYALLNSQMRRNPGVVLLLVLFIFIFGFFTFAGERSTPGLHSFGFFWGDLSLIGGVALGGLWASTLVGVRRALAAFVVASGLLLSGTRVFRDHLAAPSIAAIANPDLIEHAPGVQRDISVSFNFCQVCDQSPRIELVAVRSRSGGKEIPQDSVSRLIADASLGTDDRSIRVESSAPPPPTLKSYLLEYRIRPRRGDAKMVRASVEVRQVKPANVPRWEW